VLTTISPIIGGFAAQYKGWRWTQWSLIFVTLTAFILATPMSETYKPIILKQRAKKHEIAPTQVPADPKPKIPFTRKVARPLHMLFTEVRFALA
jgi:MFS family permease